MKRLATIILVFVFCLAKAQDKPYMENLSYYVENLQVFGEGQVDGRAYHIPSESISLNGTWKFFYGENPSEIPSDFFKPGYNDRKWAPIAVPSNWEMQGFGQALFRNVAAPFPNQRPLNFSPFGRSQASQTPPPFAVTPPNIPMDVNPTGAYRTTFNVPSSWKGEEIFLRFEKVASASFVWVNGQQVGYNEGAQEPSEYDITSFVKPGKNTLAVLVLKYSDGYYLEGQDYWRLAGIFDDVWVYASPKTRIYDWQVITDFGKDFKDSQLSLDVDVRSFGAPAAQYTLDAVVSRDGKAVAEMSSSAFEAPAVVSLGSLVKSPLKWSAETPDLYDLTMTLKDESGKVIDQVGKRIGFKKTEIIDGVFYLNGKPLKVSAECSHMQHPEQGHTMDEATIRRDMEILKQNNFNAVRTSHYPPVNKYLDLADEYGLYIIDETGDEAHATEYVSSMPEWIPMYQERVRQLVLRDRNHACVLFWSAGNESGEGPDIAEVVKEGKRLDPTRYWMYGGNAARHAAEDIVGPRYPIPIEHEAQYGINPSDKRPSFMDEYLSVAGNGGGALDDFWREIYEHPSLMGGALWDFVSVGITEPVRVLKDKSPFGTQANIMGRARLVKGRTGNAIDLNKQDQWVQVYRADNVEICGDHLTLTLDIFPRKFNKSGGYLITKGENQYGLKQQGADKLDFYIDNGSKQTLTAALPEDWEGHWHNVTAVYDGTAMKIFIDSEEVASQTMSGAIRNLPLSLCIGRSEEALGQDTNVYICDALIDNVGVFAEAVTPSDGFKAENSALWLDFEEETQDGTFYSYGIGARTYGTIWPDRTPQPEIYQIKKSTQPLSFSLLDATGGWIEIWNRNHFLPSDHYETIWTLTEDEDVIASGVINSAVEPLGRGSVQIPLKMPAQRKPGKEYRLNISSRLASDEIWAPKGFEVSWEQFELKDWNIPAEPAVSPAGTVVLKRTDDEIIASGDDFEYAFDAVTGELKRMNVAGKAVLTAPMKLNVWRAPLANELDGWNSWSMGSTGNKPGYGSIGHSSVIASAYYSAGLDQLEFIPTSVNAREVGDAAYIDVRELVAFGAGVEKQLDQYIFGRSITGFESVYSYKITADGAITVNHLVNPQGSMPGWLPRIGVTMSLSGDLREVEWYGRGPEASYPDRKTGYRVGIYRDNVDDMYEPYLIPQDYGLRTDNRWVRFTDSEGFGIEFKGIGDYFNFNAYPFTTENLTKAVYQYQLHKSDDITLNLDYATSGVGCTARGIFDAYRVYPQGFERSFVIRPVGNE